MMMDEEEERSRTKLWQQGGGVSALVSRTSRDVPNMNTAQAVPPPLGLTCQDCRATLVRASGMFHLVLPTFRLHPGSWPESAHRWVEWRSWPQAPLEGCACSGLLSPPQGKSPRDICALDPCLEQARLPGTRLGLTLPPTVSPSNSGESC